MENKKMIGTAQKLDKVMQVLQWILIACTIVLILAPIVLTIVNQVNPDAIVNSTIYTVRIGSLSLEVAPEYAPTNSSILTPLWVSISLLGSTSALAMFLCLKYIRRILSPMKLGNPFHKDAAQNFKKLAWIVLATGIIRNVIQIASSYASLRIWNLFELPQTDVIRSVQASFELEVGFVLVVFGLLLMSYIFRYGASLQQLSDETL